MDQGNDDFNAFGLFPLRETAKTSRLIKKPLYHSYTHSQLDILNERMKERPGNTDSVYESVESKN